MLVNIFQLTLLPRYENWKKKDEWRAILVVILCEHKKKSYQQHCVTEWVIFMVIYAIFNGFESQSFVSMRERRQIKERSCGRILKLDVVYTYKHRVHDVVDFSMNIKNVTAFFALKI